MLVSMLVSLLVSLTVASDGIATVAEVMAAARNNFDRFFINNGSYKIYDTENCQDLACWY